jgi:hypothetical protein
MYRHIGAGKGMSYKTSISPITSLPFNLNSSFPSIKPDLSPILLSFALFSYYIVSCYAMLRHVPSALFRVRVDDIGRYLG